MLDINNNEEAVDSTLTDSNFDALIELVTDVLGSDWVDLLQHLKGDVVYQNVTYLGFARAPAAKANHHDVIGGLVLHILEMWDIHTKVGTTLDIHDVLITPKRVLAGIILHDLHKGWCHFVVGGTAKSGLDYGKHPSSNLLTADQKTVYIASRYVYLDILQLNAVYHSEGGWASSPPRWGSVLAKYLYLLDELSSNISDRTVGVGFDENFVRVFGDKGVSTDFPFSFDLS